MNGFRHDARNQLMIRQHLATVYSTYVGDELVDSFRLNLQSLVNNILSQIITDSFLYPCTAWIV